MSEQTILHTGGQQLPAKIYVITENQPIEEYQVKEHMIIGRNTSHSRVDIPLRGTGVSRQHGELVFTGRQYYYRDLSSSNGTYINEVPYGVAAPNGKDYKELQNGDVIRIMDSVILFLTEYVKNSTWEMQYLTGDIAELNIGRQNPAYGIALYDRTVSRNHASFFKAAEGWAIVDHNSTNGVYVNNNRLGKPIYLNPLDVIRIGDTNFVYMDDRLLWNQEAISQSYGAHDAYSDPGAYGDRRGYDRQRDYGGYRHPGGTDYRGGYQGRSVGKSLFINIQQRSVWQRFKKLTLLQDINLTIQNGEMVLILGGSGAGKTTFVNAVIGYEKAEGTIRHGDIDIYTEYDRMKYEIGFAQQKNLLRGRDTVYDTLQDAAKMKLPKNISHADRERRIEDVLQLFGLQRERDSLVSKLSGGQEKRLNIAVEFISNPSLFFLDEPDSGLDGIMARSLMESLRTIADRGKIVVVITHQPDRVIDLFDKVIVLAKSVKDNCGHLAFFGSPDEAKSFFSADSMEGVVKRINRPDEGGDGKSDYYIEKFDRMQGGRY